MQQNFNAYYCSDYDKLILNSNYKLKIKKIIFEYNFYKKI